MQFPGDNNMLPELKIFILISLVGVACCPIMSTSVDYYPDTFELKLLYRNFTSYCSQQSKATTDRLRKCEKRLLSEADGTLGLHVKLQQFLNLCYIKAFPLAADSI